MMSRYLVSVFFIASFNIFSVPFLQPGEDTLVQLSRLGFYNAVPVKLHLGCGVIHFEDYINIDYPPSNHSVMQAGIAADVFCDITKLCFPKSSVQEVRLHHVFEHFFRQTALALLCAWHTWLVPDGKLLLEVPDFKACVQFVFDESTSYKQKQRMLRHVCGSHEASWAVHCDQWYREKFIHILPMLGFQIDSIVYDTVQYQKETVMKNIILTARKIRSLSVEELSKVAYQILSDSQMGIEDSCFAFWCKEFDDIIRYMIITR